MVRIFRKRIMRKRPVSVRRWRGTKALSRKFGTSRLKFHRSPFPSVMYATLNFAGMYTLTSNDTDQIQSFRLNSVYDVDYTGVGAQPRLTDTLLGADSGNAPYGSYRVISADYYIRVANGNSSGNSMGPVGVHIRNENSTAITPITVEQLGEVPFTKYAVIGPSGSSHCQKIFKGHVDVKKFFATKNASDNERLAAAYNANPSDVVMLDVMYRTLNSGGASFNCYFDVKIKLNVQFYDRNLTSIS